MGRATSDPSAMPKSTRSAEAPQHPVRLHHRVGSPVANKTFRIKHCATNSKHNICYRKAHHEREPEAAISAGHVLATVLALDVLNAKVPDAVIEILATKMSDPRSGCDSKASIPNGEGRNIEGQATPVIDDKLRATAPFISSPYAIAATVGSLMICNSFKTQI
jgi:hypothetical protein